MSSINPIIKTQISGALRLHLELRSRGLRAPDALGDLPTVFARAVQNDPEGLMHPRASWAAMTSCLIKLARHEELSADDLAEVPEPHRSHLLGHAAGHRQMCELYERHNRAKDMLSDLLGRIDENDRAAREAAYAIIAMLRGEQAETVEP